MDGVESITDNDGVADVFLWGQPHRITHARTYFRLKHLAAWSVLIGQAKPITLHVWDDWEHLGDRLSARWGRYLWHPSHWDTYYATLPEVPASAPGAIPQTMADVRATRKRQEEEQYALF